MLHLKHFEYIARIFGATDCETLQLANRFSGANQTVDQRDGNVVPGLGVYLLNRLLGSNAFRVLTTEL